MASSGSRKGVEKKIMTSILWVGVVPMIVVFVMGYLIVRHGLSNSAETELENKARILARAIDNGVNRLRPGEHIQRRLARCRVALRVPRRRGHRDQSRRSAGPGAGAEQSRG